MYGGKPTIEFRIEVAVEPDEIGFHAYCPALKGLHTYGDTEEEALQNAGDAAIAYLQSLMKHGDPIPVGITVREEVERRPHFAATRVSYRTEDLTVACAI